MRKTRWTVTEYFSHLVFTDDLKQRIAEFRPQPMEPP